MPREISTGIARGQEPPSNEEVIEVSFLLPIHQLMELERRARHQGSTIAQQLRSIIRGWLENPSCNSRV